MRRCLFFLVVGLVGMIFLAGCSNPVKREPGNVFPGSEYYSKRVATLKITPQQAYDIAHAQAQEDGRLHVLSRTPTVLMKKTYVFSMPQASGASVQGYHVNGENGKVKYVSEKRTVHP